MRKLWWWPQRSDRFQHIADRLNAIDHMYDNIRPNSESDEHQDKLDYAHSLSDKSERDYALRWIRDQ